MRKGFKRAKTSVFWDVVDFPNPNEGRSFYERVKSALKKDRYCGEVSIIAYGEKRPENLDDGIVFIPKRTKYARLNKMLLDISFWALDYPDSLTVPTNLMFIAKNIPEDTDFVTSLAALQTFHFNVLLVVDDECEPEKAPLPKLSTIWFWGSLLAGEKPLRPDRVHGLLARVKQESDDDMEKFALDDTPCPLCKDDSCSKEIPLQR